MLALTWRGEAAVRELIAASRHLTARPFGANFVLAFDIDDKLARALEMGVPIISTAWGDPAIHHARISGAGALHIHSCGSVEEAQRAAEAGVDAVIAQGWEAGGHVLGRTTTMALVPAVVDAIHPLPVIAAGGIGDGRGLAAALVLGAQAASIGTAFLVAEEAATHEVYRESVINASPDEAAYTLAFDGGWPGAPHRALQNSTLDDWEAAGRPVAPQRPGEGDVVAVDAAGALHYRYEDLMPLPGMTGDLDQMALYAGQSAGVVREVAPAAAIVSSLMREAEVALSSRD
jgi:nitronate monooxygenase/enoyl-[acyl-carrier protein] reductase II